MGSDMEQITKLAREKYYLVSQGQIDKIDSLIAALGLAVAEILERRPVRSPSESTAAQDDYDDAIGNIIYRNAPVEF
jgi:hypothetical protein